MNTRNIGASVRAKLLNYSKNNNQEYNLTLTRFMSERLLYRLSISEYSDLFLLKGALLFDLWFDVPYRPTRDIDFLGFGSSELSQLHKTFQEICKIEVEDGVKLDSESVRVSEIRKEVAYAGVRVSLTGFLDTARISIQIDVGFGDAVTPKPDNAEFPVILSEFKAPKIRAYPRYTVVAEKTETILSLGIANSRMKDYFDLWILSQFAEFDGVLLTEALGQTCRRRKTHIPNDLPLGLSEVFSEDRSKAVQWSAFIKRNKLSTPELKEVVSMLRSFLVPPLKASHSEEPFVLFWKSDSSWSERMDKSS
jgi:Nucleotidyl transferase AbiEii toxin, Type IV TA system